MFDILIPIHYPFPVTWRPRVWACPRNLTSQLQLSCFWPQKVQDSKELCKVDLLNIIVHQIIFSGAIGLNTSRAQEFRSRTALTKLNCKQMPDDNSNLLLSQFKGEILFTGCHTFLATLALRI